ncbi:hypothetical protein ACIGMX_34955 [Streptomyces aquilus]|uniref:hypothetical protein n=1 Tax=Streptomyces aquilus TaxID=2548456 RepID=UPI0037CD202E
MKFPFVWRRTAEDETQVWKDEAARQRRRADLAERSLATEVTARRHATELYSDLYDEHESLLSKHSTLRAQSPGHKQAKQMAERIVRLQKGVAKARAERSEEKRRYDGLQRRYDDAVGLTAGAIQDSRSWQPGYEKPKADAS